MSNILINFTDEEPIFLIYHEIVLYFFFLDYRRIDVKWWYAITIKEWTNRITYIWSVYEQIYAQNHLKNSIQICLEK